MKLPKQIVIGPYHFRVRSGKKHKKHAGWIKYFDGVIAVDDSNHRDVVLVTLAHESLHGMCMAANLGLGQKLEERVVSALDSRIIEWIRDNRRLIAEILEEQ